MTAKIIRKECKKYRETYIFKIIESIIYVKEPLSTMYVDTKCFVGFNGKVYKYNEFLEDELISDNIYQYIDNYVFDCSNNHIYDYIPGVPFLKRIL